MPIPVYHMSFHRAAGKAINFVNDSHGRYWFRYCHFIQTEYVFSQD